MEAERELRQEESKTIILLSKICRLTVIGATKTNAIGNLSPPLQNKTHRHLTCHDGGQMAYHFQK